MDVKFVAHIVIALIAVGFVVYGILNEKKFIAFEDKILLKLKKFFRK